MTVHSGYRGRRVIIAAMTIAIVQFAACQRDGRSPGNRWNIFAKAPRRLPGLAQQTPPPKIGPKQKANVKMALARSLERKGETDEAIKVYADVIRKDSHRADAAHRLAVLHDKKGNYKKSAEYYRRALKGNPQNAEAYCDFGYSCYLQQHWKEAETNLKEALKLNPELKRAHNNLGLVLARTGRPEEAFAEFRQAGCGEAEARANLAFAFMFEERWQDAQRQFHLALSADPSSKTARDGLKTVHSLLAGPQRGQAALAAHHGDAQAVQVKFAR